MGGMGLTREGVAIIYVSDINNHAPQFSPASVSLTQQHMRAIFNCYFKTLNSYLVGYELLIPLIIYYNNHFVTLVRIL